MQRAGVPFWRYFSCVVYALPALAQPQKVFTLNDISDLIKNGVTPNRIAQLVEERGVGFELDDRALRRLKQDGANETVLSAVKKMSARYTKRDSGTTAGRRNQTKAGREEAESAERASKNASKPRERKRWPEKLKRLRGKHKKKRDKNPRDPLWGPRKESRACAT